MDQRLKLHSLLKTILGSNNVYFQPPPSVQMSYPAIVYERDNADNKFAGNLPYRQTTRYQITVIDRDPDSEVPKRVAALPLCTFSRYYAAENLNHDIYSLYF